MRIGKQDQSFSAISTSTPETITVRGKDLVRDLIGQVDFTSYFWFLSGRAPSPRPVQRFLRRRRAGGHRRAWAGAQRGRRAHDRRGGARRGLPGRGGGGPARLRLGGAGQCRKPPAASWPSWRRPPGGTAPIPPPSRPPGVRDLRARKQAIPGFGIPCTPKAIPGATCCCAWRRRRVCGAPFGMLHAVHGVLPQVWAGPCRSM
ncbi:MAG: hypothetical protein WDN45_16660 [Caulobacteraceae bacterium]